MTSINFNSQNFFQRPIDPNAYAQNYAASNNMSVEDAKASLLESYGEPIFKNETQNDFSSTGLIELTDSDFEFLNELNSINSEVDDDSNNFSISNLFNKFMGFIGGNNNSQNLGQDPDEYAQEYAEQNNISIQEAKNILRELYGEPTQPDLQ